MAKKRKRVFYELADRRSGILELTPESLAVVCERYTCPHHMLSDGDPEKSQIPLGSLSSHWNRYPEPINIAVVKVAKCYVDCVIGLDTTLLEHSLVEVLRPHFKDVYIGRVMVASETGGLEQSPMMTIAATLANKIQSDRSRYSRHFYKECCGLCTNTVGWATGAIVERTLDDRQVYVNQDGNVLVDGELAARLGLKERFPKLWLRKVDVIPEPLDAETLPGDPGWSGVIQRKYPAMLNVFASIPYAFQMPAGEERSIYSEVLVNLNRELDAIGAERAFQDGGSHGSCLYHARGFDIPSLKEAAVRAVSSSFRDRVDFTIGVDLSVDHGKNPFERVHLPIIKS